MSTARELLEEALDRVIEVGNYELSERIKDHLRQPEPEPVAYIIKGATITGAEASYLSWNKTGAGFVAAPIKSYEPIPLYTAQPDQSARIAELELQVAELHDKLDKADAEIDRLSTIHQTTHDRLLRGDNNKELLECLRGGWIDSRDEYINRLNRLQTRIDSGVRVYAWSSGNGMLIADQSYDQTNATLLLDKVGE